MIANGRLRVPGRPFALTCLANDSPTMCFHTGQYGDHWLDAVNSKWYWWCPDSLRDPRRTFSTRHDRHLIRRGLFSIRFDQCRGFDVSINE